ncbi:MAG: ABC transporter permease subunit [Clostridia bacterium]|nr:ABC transporter permease subunit [Clostridia bacterium]
MNKNQLLWKRIVQHKTLYLLLLPLIFYYIFLRYWPIVLAWIVAFKNLQMGSGVSTSPWVGFDNFKFIVSDPEIATAFKNTVQISLLRLAVGFMPPIFLAIMFHDMTSKTLKKYAQTAVYIPYFFSWVIIYGIAFAFFSTGSGFVNNLLDMMGLPRQEFLMSTDWFRPILIIMSMWKELGWGTIIYMAALSTVDTQLYEAAIMDGAGPLKRIAHITIPSILPVVTFVLCINLGHMFYAGGEQVLLFYNKAVMDVADIIDTWVYRVGIGNMRFSLGAAVGLLQSLFGMILILASNHASKKLTGNGIW